MEPHEVLRTRLAGQQLRETRAGTAEDALKNLLAVQAQEFPYARWSLAQRTTGATAADVEQSVADGRIPERRRAGGSGGRRNPPHP
jgi:hypothetical protein